MARAALSGPGLVDEATIVAHRNKYPGSAARITLSHEAAIVPASFISPLRQL